MDGKDKLLDGDDGSIASSLAAKKVALNSKYDRKFMIARDNLHEKKIYRLRHPKSFTAALYAVGTDAVEELLRIEDPYRSFFYGESVVANGYITMACMVHPLFLVIPYLLRNAMECFVPIESILVDEEFPAVTLLVCNEKLLKSLELICEYKFVSGTKFWKCNEKMLLKWLEVCFEKLKCSLLKNMTLHKAITESDDVLRRYTYSLLSDYIPQDVSLKLKEFLKITNAEVEKTVQPLKRKLESGREIESYYGDAENVKQRKPQLSAVQKKLHAASKGTKSIFGFINREK